MGEKLPCENLLLYGGDGERYTGSELYHRSNGAAEKAGDETLIWYDPENPADSSYHKPGPGLDPYGVYFLRWRRWPLRGWRKTTERVKCIFSICQFFVPCTDKGLSF